MREVKYLLIGGGLAAVRAAQQIRTLDADGAVLAVSDEPVIPYDRPPLSKDYLAGEKSIEAITLESADKLRDAKIEFALGHAVTKLDPAAKTATLANGEEISFAKALIATGGRPVHLDLPGADLPGIHYLRTAADADAINADAKPGKKAEIIGGGFIGLETAPTLRKRGGEETG
ncbi:MAG: FAD-dependent oxidoreductase, partial [Hyphomonadaceae bacterium]